MLVVTKKKVHQRKNKQAMDNIKVLRVRDVKLPERGTSLSAGIDFFIPNDFKETTLLPHTDILIPSGICVSLPKDTMLMGAEKSGIASSKSAKESCGMKTKVTAHNTSLIVGAKIVDEDYPGEVHLHIVNVGNRVAHLTPGMKITQFIIVPVLYSAVEEVFEKEDLSIAKTDRIGGFGSTGV